MTAQNDRREVWRWNADPVWLQVLAMFQESYFATVAPHEFARQHHTRACLYFAMGSVEVFLNRRMREKLERDGIAESNIYRQLRSTRILDKARKWPEILAGRTVPLAEDFFGRLSAMKDLRDEATHQKRRDHSLYVEIDTSHTAPAVSAIVEAIVTIDTACGRTFPYWLLGWTHVGMNNDPSQPVALPNSEFQHSLRLMGYDVSAWDYEKARVWEQHFMTSFEGYRKLKQTLDLYPDHIEPVWQEFPSRPRLCRRWWDRRLTLGRDPGPDIPRWVKGWGVFRSSPWHFIGLFDDRKVAENAARQAGPDYEIHFGDHCPGTDDFVYDDTPESSLAEG